MEFTGTAQISFVNLEGGLYLPGKPVFKGGGKWGIRVATKGRTPNPGDTVIVSKADHTHQRVTVGSYIGVDRNAFPAPAHYYTIQRDGSSRPQRPTKAQVRQSYYAQEQARLAAERERVREACVQALREEYRTVRDQLRGYEAEYDANEGFDGEMDDVMQELRDRLTELVASAEAVKAA